MDIRETICAVSTAPGVGGIAVVRVSGMEAFLIVDKVFRSTRQSFRVQDAKSHTVHWGQVMDGKGQVLDEVVITIFRSPHSFTGEDTVEISCHGSLFIQRELLKLLIEKGCRMALAGEFTQRAFANGKMDLSQAESVADLIASQSVASHRLAMNQMRGGFSKEITILRERLLTFTSLVELELDFADHEELEFADRSELKILTKEIIEKIGKLKDSFGVGNVLKNGLPVTIVGATNVGKSTLLNVLLREERAIVSDVHGTTRDVIEDTIQLGGYQFRFIDTAGLRDTSDVVETMGIERSYREMDKASIVLWLVDASASTADAQNNYERVCSHIDRQKLIIVFNKVDLIDEEQRQNVERVYGEYSENHLFISAKMQIQTSDLEQMLIKTAQLPTVGDQDVMVTNMRHYESLCNAYNAIVRVQEGLEQNISGDFLSQDIRECLHYLGEITGEITTDEVLGNIFSHFCVGK